MISPVRKPYVAGSFYPAEPRKLQDFLAQHLEPIFPLCPAKAVILPHAGYLYSGKTVGEVLRRVKIPEVSFLLGPNHEGVGEAFALYPEGGWETPLGLVPVDREFTAGLLESSHDLRADPQAHEREHSLEVEVPFLQHRNPRVKIAPLVIGTLDLDWAREVALSLVEYLKSRPHFLIVVSTDLSHYESNAATRKKDRYALEAMVALDETALAKGVESHRITMCGFVPAVVGLVLAKALGAEKGTLVDYRTSAEASGDFDRVVGYAGLIIE